jgi:hypothetical protein
MTKEPTLSERSPKQREPLQVVLDPSPPEGSSGDQHRGHMLEQYRHFVDVTIQYWSHIAPANQFFLSLHTVILSGFIYLLTSEVRIPPLLLAGLTLLACAIALQWLMLLRSLQRLNQVRHEIIQEWERHLPAQPYVAEHYRLYVRAPARGRYFRIQKLYMLLPVLTILTYLGLAVSIALDVRVR